MSIIVYGASDDLIEVEGDISEEFPYRGDDNPADRGDLFAFSDGTVLRITYTTTGVWRIATVAEGTCTLEITQAPEGDNDNYSDRARLGDNSAVRWVVQGRDIVQRGGQ